MALQDAFRTTLTAGTMTAALTAIERRVDYQGKVMLCIYTESDNVEVKIQYVFDAGTSDAAAKDIQTIDLTSGTLTMVNFDFPTGVLRVTYNNNDSDVLTAATLKIDLHTAR